MKGLREGGESAALAADESLASASNERHVRKELAGTSRRSFLGKVGGATAVALTVGIPLEPLLEGKKGQAEASVVHYGSGARAFASFEYRKDTAEDNNVDVGELPDNSDLQRFTDYSGNWSKCLEHDALGIPNAASYRSMLHALQTGQFHDFERIIVGNPGGHGPTSPEWTAGRSGLRPGRTRLARYQLHSACAQRGKRTNSGGTG